MPAALCKILLSLVANVGISLLEAAKRSYAIESCLLISAE